MALHLHIEFEQVGVSFHPFPTSVSGLAHLYFRPIFYLCIRHASTSIVDFRFWLPDMGLARVACIASVGVVDLLLIGWWFYHAGGAYIH